MSDRRYGPTPADMVTQWDAANGRAPTGKGEWKPAGAIDFPGGRIERPTEETLLVTLDGSTPTNAGLVAPECAHQFVFSSPIPWAAKSLSVPAEIAHLFELVSMRHAMMEFVPSEPVPCSLFSDALCAGCRKVHVYENLGVRWPMVFPGSLLQVTVKNVGTVASKFRMTFEAVPYDARLGGAGVL